jgi:hypothetical protein
MTEAPVTFTLSNVRKLIDEYVASHPDGIDVIAHVLSGLGRPAVEAHAQSAQLSLDQATQEVVATARELLLRKHPASQVLEALPVSAERWPALAGWVERYPAHRIAAAGPPA